MRTRGRPGSKTRGCNREGGEAAEGLAASPTRRWPPIIAKGMATSRERGEGSAKASQLDTGGTAANSLSEEPFRRPFSGVYLENGSAGRTCTDDLLVMSQASCCCSTAHEFIATPATPAWRRERPASRAAPTPLVGLAAICLPPGAHLGKPPAIYRARKATAEPMEAAALSAAPIETSVWRRPSVAAFEQPHQPLERVGDPAGGLLGDHLPALPAAAMLTEFSPADRARLLTATALPAIHNRPRGEVT